MENNQPKEKKSMNMRALKGGSYSLVLCAVVLVLVIVINLLVNALPSNMTKLDASSVGILNLSEETKQIISGVNEPVTLYLLVQRGQENLIIQELLQRYADLNANIQVEEVDPDIHPGFSAEYTSDTLNQNSVIVVSDRRSYVIDYSQIFITSYENITQEEYFNYVYYGIMPQGTPYFYGEVMLSSALEYVTTETIPTVYSLNNHSEDALSETMLSYFSTDNILSKELSLLADSGIPDDCSAILLNNPKTDISAYEAQQLTAYLQAGGNVILITDFRYYTNEKMPNLASVAALMGMESEDGILVEGSRQNYNTYPTFLLPTIGTQGPATVLASGISALLPNAHGIVLSGTGDAETNTLLRTSDSAFVKKAGTDMTTYEFEDGDIKGSFHIAASATLAAENGESKFVWFSSTGIVSDQWDYYVNGGNSEIFMASVNWMCEKAVSVSVIAKSMQVQALVIPESSANAWSSILTIVIPLAVLGGGFWIWLRRRRK